jgi:hypothetical protein
MATPRKRSSSAGEPSGAQSRRRRADATEQSAAEPQTRRYRARRALYDGPARVLRPGDTFDARDDDPRVLSGQAQLVTDDDAPEHVRVAFDSLS